MKKSVLIIIWTGIVLLVAAAAFALAFVLEWRKCADSPEAPVLVSEAFAPEKPVRIAEKIPFVLRVRTPWARVPAGLTVTPGAGSQEAGTPVCEVETRSWGTLTWIVKADLQAYRRGEIPAGSVQVDFEGGPSGVQSVKAVLPGFKAEAVVPENSDLDVAGKMEIREPESKTWLWVVSAAVVALAVLGWAVARRRAAENDEKAKPVWEQALDAIGSLRNSLHGGKTTPEAAVTSLTDVVRRYLERRFRLRAEHQTTPEFLKELSDDSSPLAPDQREFLGGFLSSADMVKFAKLPADVHLFDNAAEKAESLVRNTAVDDTGREALP